MQIMYAHFDAYPSDRASPEIPVQDTEVLVHPMEVHVQHICSSVMISSGFESRTNVHDVVEFCGHYTNALNHLQEMAKTVCQSLPDLMS